MSATDYFFVRTDRVIKKLKVDDILYITSLKDYIKIATKQGDLIVHCTTEAILKKSPRLTRVHRGHIVVIENIDDIRMDKDGLHVAKKFIPIGGKYKKALLKKIKIL